MAALGRSCCQTVVAAVELAASAAHGNSQTEHSVAGDLRRQQSFVVEEVAADQMQQSFAESLDQMQRNFAAVEVGAVGQKQRNSVAVLYETIQSLLVKQTLAVEAD